MTTSIPQDKDVDAEIRAAQVRDCLLLLHSPLSPADCLRQAELLLSGQREAERVVLALDHVAVPLAAHDDHQAICAQLKGSLLGAMNGVRDLGTRMHYFNALEKHTAKYLLELKGCQDPVKMLEVTSRAVDARNALREKMFVKSSKAVAVYQRDGWAGLGGVYRHVTGSSSEDKHTVSHLLRAKGKNKPLDKMTDAEQEVLCKRIISGSGSMGVSIAKAWTVFKASKATLETTVDLLMVIDEVRYGRDPFRSVSSSAVRVGAAAAVSTFTEAAIFTLVAGLGLSTGVGTLIMLGGTFFANQALNDWINDSFLAFYDELSPRISATMRDVSWEAVDFKTDLMGESLASTMTSQLKTSML